MNAPNAFAHAFIRAPGQVDRTELSKDLQGQVVAIRLLDARHQRQQQVSRGVLVGRERQAVGLCKGTFEVVGDRHGCIISLDRPANPERRTCSACPPCRTTPDQPHETLMLKSLVIIPAIGFFRSAPSA